MLTWHYLTSTAYNNLVESEKTSDKLFYIKDTKDIYCGTDRFLQSIVLYANSEPTTNAKSKLYVNAYTLEGKVWDKTRWVSTIHPIRDVSECGTVDLDDIVSVKYISEDNTIEVITIDGNVDSVDLYKLTIDLLLDMNTGDILVEKCSAHMSSNNDYINLDYFVSEISYSDNKISILFGNEDMLYFDLSQHIENKDGILPITITGNYFVAETVLASNDNNIGNIQNDLHVVTNINRCSNYGIITFDNNTTGTEGTTSEEISTEGAYEIRTALATSIEDKMTKVGSGYTGEIIIADSEGNAAASGVKIGKATISETPTNNTVATEKAIVTYIESIALTKSRISTSENMATTVEKASDDLIASEKSLLKAASWNII